MNQQLIGEIADLLWQAEQGGAPCAPVRERILEAADGGDPAAAA